MYRKTFLRIMIGSAVAACGVAKPLVAHAQAQHDGSERRPLRVVLIPAEGGTADGTLRDFQPVFGAISRATGLRFDIRTGQTYGAVVEAMCGGAADIAWFGPLTYLQARNRGCAELLAVDVVDGESVYFSGIFGRREAGIAGITGLRGRRLALNDPNSTSGFAIPVAMMLAAGINPARDTAAIHLASSHAAVLQMLNEGLVDAGGAAFISFERAVNNRVIDPSQIMVVAKSDPIPNPPMAVHPRVSAEIKARLREAFNNVHQMPGVTRDQIRGFGGRRVDRYNANVTEEFMSGAARLFDLLTEQIRSDIIARGSRR